MGIDKHRGHRPRLLDTVTKRQGCSVCGTSWDRGSKPPCPCHGPRRERSSTPELGIQNSMRGSLR